MLTTTHRGWWPALEPALLAFAAVVCSGVSLLALSQAFASDCRHQCDTTRSSFWTVAAADQDPLDDDDDDDAPDASVAATIVLTNDDGFGRPLVEREVDVAPTLRTEQLAPRGPPDRPRVSHHSERHLQWPLFAGPAPASTHWTGDPHDSIDDGDDDGDDDDDDGDGADDIGDAAAALTSQTTDDDSHHPVISAEFGVALRLRSENLAPRGPPADRHLPACRAHDSAPSSDESSDVDVTGSDDDDDDDGAELDRSSVAATRGSGCLLIAATADHFCSFASHDHSLRAPPQ